MKLFGITIQVMLLKTSTKKLMCATLIRQNSIAVEELDPASLLELRKIAHPNQQFKYHISSLPVILTSKLRDKSYRR
jgi:hypothetical protein